MRYVNTPYTPMVYLLSLLVFSSSLAAQPTGELRDLRETFGKLKYLVLLSEARGGSPLKRPVYIPQDTKFPVLPPQCIGQINRERKKLGLEEDFNDYVLRPTTSPFPTAETRALTQGEKDLPFGYCTRMNLRMNRNKASVRKAFIPRRPANHTQTFCTKQNGRRVCTYPVDELNLNFQKQTRKKDTRQTLQFINLPEENLAVARLNVINTVMRGGDAQDKVSTGVSCGLACRNKKQCTNAIARLGEDGVRDLCQLTIFPDEFADSCLLPKESLEAANRVLCPGTTPDTELICGIQEDLIDALDDGECVSDLPCSELFSAVENICVRLAASAEACEVTKAVMSIALYGEEAPEKCLGGN